MLFLMGVLLPRSMLTASESEEWLKKWLTPKSMALKQTRMFILLNSCPEKLHFLDLKKNSKHMHYQPLYSEV